MRRITPAALTALVALTALLALGCADDRLGRAPAGVVDGPVAFAPRREIRGGPMVSVDAADFDGDGLLDVAVFGSSTMAWYESPADPATGTWTRHDFGAPDTVDFKGAAQAADIDDDGDPDVVYTMDRHSGRTREAYGYVLMNPGGAATGTWAAEPIFEDLAVHHINDMVVEDMDGDGRLDVVLRALTPNEILIYFQNGLTDWTERRFSTSPADDRGEGLAVGDVDGIGHPDLTLSGYWWHAPSDPRTGAYVAHVVDDGRGFNWNTKEDLADVDDDGDLDLLIAPAEGFRSGPNYDLAVYLNPGTPRTAAGWSSRVLRRDFNAGHFARFVDLDDDGDPDVVVGQAWSRWGQTSSIRAFYNLGGGVFGHEQTIATGGGVYTGAIADFGDDGDLDIIGGRTYRGQLDFHESLESGAPPPPVDGGPPDDGPRPDLGVDGGVPLERPDDGPLASPDAGPEPDRDLGPPAAPLDFGPRPAAEPDAGPPPSPPRPRSTAIVGGCAAASCSRSTWPLGVLFALAVRSVRRRSRRRRRDRPTA